MGTEREHADGNVIPGPWGRRPPTATDERRRDELVAEIAEQMEVGSGSVARWTGELDDVDEWRAAARKAGRLLGAKVRTGVADDGAKVWVIDVSSAG